MRRAHRRRSLLLLLLLVVLQRPIGLCSTAPTRTRKAGGQTDGQYVYREREWDGGRVRVDSFLRMWTDIMSRWAGAYVCMQMGPAQL